MVEKNLLSEERAIQETDSWLDQKIFGTVEEELYQRGSFSVYIIRASVDNKQFEGVGFGKARQEVSITKYDPERGKNVAKGRAVHDLFIDYKKYREIQKKK